MSTTETTQEAPHEHAFPCNPPGGTYLRPGSCECGKTYDQARADESLRRAVSLLLAVYGDAAPVSTHWAVAFGGEDANDCAGLLEYDDEADCRDMTQWIDGGFVARQTVIRLPWEAVPGEEPTP